MSGDGGGGGEGGDKRHYVGTNCEHVRKLPAFLYLADITSPPPPPLDLPLSTKEGIWKEMSLH